MIASILAGVTAAFLLLTAQHVHAATAWVVCAPFAWLQTKDGRWRDAYATAVVFALTVTMVGEVPWLVETGQGYFALSPPAAWMGAVVLAGIIGIIYGSVLGAGLCGLARFPALAFVVAFAALWTVWEELLLRFVPYYPWAALAPTQVDFTTASQAVSLVGQRGLSWAIAFSGINVGMALRETARGARASGLRRAALTWVAVLGFGSARLHLAETTALPCSVAAVDARIDSPRIGSDETLRRYMQFAQEAQATGASILIWPESALLVDPLTNATLQARLRQIVQATGMALIAGGPRTAWDAKWQASVFNSAYLLDGASITAYDKRHLVPFAEYWPSILIPRPAFLQIEETAGGMTPGLFTVAGCRFGILICFEAEQPRLARDLQSLGANALLVLSNDAQLPALVAKREQQQARLRALETGLPVVRAANGGDSLMIDRFGRIIDQRSGGVLSNGHP